MSDVLNEYVRFQRGSQSAYNALKNAGKLDRNTLYFIYDDVNKSVGALYMGDRIISSGDITVASASLDDLVDVKLTDATAGSFLVREGEQWVNKSLEDVASLIKENIGDTAAPAQVFQATRIATDADDYDAILRAVGTEKVPAVGDIAIIQTPITDGKNQYTAYVFDGEVWAAMDGNYSAENVYFNSNLVFTHSFGKYVPGTSGSVNVPAKGINLKELLENAYSEETKTGLITANPTASINGSVKYYEIGSTGTQDITVSLNSDGEYKYGYSKVDGNEGDVVESTDIVNDKTTGVVVDTSKTSPYTLKFNGASVEPKVVGGSVFTLAPTAQIEKTEMKAQGTVYHTAGKNPVSNLSKTYPSQKIAAGSKSSAEGARARWFIPMYQGFTFSNNAIANPAAITAAELTALTAPSTSTVGAVAKVTGETAYNETKNKTATANKAWRQYFLAFPKTYGWTMSGAKDANNIDCTVRQAADVTMSFGSGDTAVDVVYSVFYINNAADYGTLKIAWNL